MPGKDLHPNPREESSMGSFRYGTNRKVEITLRKELDDLAKKSLTEIANKREERRVAPLDEEQLTSRKLTKEFVPQRVKEKRKTEPVFHEDILAKEAKTEPKFILKPNVPPYNPLDKDGYQSKVTLAGKTKKFPYSKETVITTQVDTQHYPIETLSDGWMSDMKKPHVSSVGVTPSRISAGVPGLKVIMEGQTIATGDDSALEQMVLANKARPLTPVTPLTTDRETLAETPGDTAREPEEEDVTQPKEDPKKPAILTSEGTLQRVTFLQRQKPVIPASSLRKPKRRLGAVSVASSLRSENVQLPDEAVYSKYDDAIDAMDDDIDTAVRLDERGEGRSPMTSVGTVKSTKDLLEEAKKISRPGSEPMWKMQGKKSPTRRDGKKDGKKDKKAQEKMKQKAKEKEEEVEGKPKVRTERTVDEIIASLRAGSGAKSQMSDADRKIKEIMDRVMSRASAVLSDQDSQYGEGADTRRVDSEMGLDRDSLSVPPTPQQGDTVSPRGKFDQIDGDRTDLDVPEQIHEGEELKVTDQGLDIDYSELKSDKMTSEDLTVTSEAKTGDDVSQAKTSEAEQEKTVTIVPPLQLTDQPQEVDEESEEEMDDESEMLDIKQAWEDYMAPPEATLEDIVSVQGTVLDLVDRQPAKSDASSKPVYSSSVSFLSTWKPISASKFKAEPPKVEKEPTKHVHHFCTVTSDYQLPEEFRNLGRKYHAPDRYESNLLPQEAMLASRGQTFIQDTSEDTKSQITQISESRELEEKRLASAARRVLEEAEGRKAKGVSDTLEVWQQRAEEVFPAVSIEGTKVSLKSDDSRLYWTPAPPKFDVPPAKVKDVLFPEYQPATMAMESRGVSVTQEEVEESDEEDEEEEIVDDKEERYREIYSLLHHKSNSFEDISDFMLAKEQQMLDVKAGKVPLYEKRKLLPGEEPPEEEKPAAPETEQEGSRGSTPVGPSQKVEEDSSSEFVFPLLKRSKSTPMLWTEDEEDVLVVPQDYNTAMEEISMQRANVRRMKLNKKIEVARMIEEEKRALQQQRYLEKMEAQASDMEMMETKKKDEPSPAELALEAGRAYVILPKKKKKKKPGQVSMARIEEVEKFLRLKPRKMERSASMIRIPKPIETEFRVPSKVRLGSRVSVPNLLDFDLYAKRKNMPADCDTREWVRDIWNIWFDQVFPPTPSESEEEEFEEVRDEQVSPSKEEKEKERKRRDSLSSYVSDSLSVIEPLEDSEQSLEEQQIIFEETEKLTKLISMTSKPRAFDLCRRGGLYRKIGMIKAAQVDLDLAIKLEPLLLDAYWHRHLLYLLQDKRQQAKDDLKFILKHNYNHGGAYRSMADILKREGNHNEAIMNYSKAIRLNPKDHEAYFQRAAMYEKTDKMPLALDDYMMCKRILPTRTDAILKHGMYYFQMQNWNTAIQDFTDLLKVDSLNAMARMYRGRAYSKMNQWNAAVEDLSAAIHLDPNSWEAFFHRACILRKAHPKHALHDYSVSLLINDNEENIMSYLHRGILYNAMHRFEDAIPDFESVLKLNKDIACAHVNLGLIFMNHYENYHRAIKKFTAGIKVDPTYVRAYVCRGEAYHKIHELKAALKDFTRAIHLRPDIHHYYMYRGQLVLELGNLELAAFCVRHAAEMSSDSSLGQMPTQQAVVQSFLKNYDKAIDALTSATRVKPVPPLFMLLGKTQMKAKTFKEAIVSFDKALQLYRPWRREPWPMEASECHFLIGMCHIELKEFTDAKEAFTSAVKINPNYAEALYQRGVAKMKLSSRGLSREGIQDINRSLAINPKIFQAYLSRACYYGMKKNYTKAILNCNEAIKLQPRSVRAYLYRGALKYHIMAFDLAIRDLDTAASIDSTCELAYFNRAVCFQEKRMFDKRLKAVIGYQENTMYFKALKDYGIVLLLGEDDRLRAKVLINRGLLYFERKDYTNALYDFKLAAKLDPKDHRILHTLGLCYHKMDRLKEAVEVFTTCLQKHPFFIDGIIARGNVYMDYGSKGGLIYARRDYERALRQNPLHLPARVNLAYTLQVSGKFMQAWKQFTAAIEIRSTYKPALEGRAIINLQMSNTFAAYQDINASVKVAPTAELLTNRGVINQFMEDRVNAMRDYQNAIKMDPTYSLAYFNAANIYFHTRHFRQALEYYSKTIEYNPKDESAHLNRAITKVMLRDAKGALADFKGAIKLSPYTAHMYFNRGNLYASMEDFEKAEKDYSKALSLKPDDALVLKRRADVRGKLGMKNEAIADYKLAIDIQSHLEGN